MPERIRCWDCLGKCQVFGYARGGDDKPSWFACKVCKGRGWVPMVDGAVQKLEDALFWVGPEDEDETPERR